MPKLKKPHWHTRLGFRNPEGTNGFRLYLSDILVFFWSRLFVPPLQLGQDVAADHILAPEKAKEGLAANGASTITWLGHCAFLIRHQGFNILIDPFIDGHAGPRFFRGLRRLPSPLAPEELPPIDLLLLSHEHYDHLHTGNLRRIPKSPDMRTIVPLRVSRRLHGCGLKDIVELDWFEENEAGPLTITSLPAVHYSVPLINRSLWAGFKIGFKDGRAPIYFSGDSGYGPTFKRDIAPHGPFGMALVGIGSIFVKGVRLPARTVHTDPEDAVRVAEEIGAKELIGMHWGTVRMTDEKQHELPLRLMKAAAAARGGKGLPASVMRIGETRPLPV